MHAISVFDVFGMLDPLALRRHCRRIKQGWSSQDQNGGRYSRHTHTNWTQHIYSPSTGWFYRLVKSPFPLPSYLRLNPITSVSTKRSAVLFKVESNLRGRLLICPTVE